MAAEVTCAYPTHRQASITESIRVYGRHKMWFGMHSLKLKVKSDFIQN